MSDPQRIYLQAPCCAEAEFGRLWCQDREPVQCDDSDCEAPPERRSPTEYMRADLYDEAMERAEQAEELLAGRETLRQQAEARAEQAERERDATLARERRMREALSSIDLYGSDTLSGRIDGPDDREWQRAAVAELVKRARAALADAPEPSGDAAPDARDRLIEELAEALSVVLAPAEWDGDPQALGRVTLNAYREWKEANDGHQG